MHRSYHASRQSTISCVTVKSKLSIHQLFISYMWRMHTTEIIKWKITSKTNPTFHHWWRKEFFFFFIKIIDFSWLFFLLFSQTFFAFLILFFVVCVYGSSISFQFPFIFQVYKRFLCGAHGRMSPLFCWHERKAKKNL